jgi:hypothetical protein
MKITKRYVSRKGFFIKDEDAIIYGKCLSEIEKKTLLTPRNVVDEARNPKSPLHDYFEWNNRVAGEKYRIWQAQYLMRAIEVVVTVDGKEETTRKFFSVKVNQEDEKTQRSYVSVEYITKNKNYYNQVIEYALKELTCWQNQYSQYKELAPIFAAIEKVRGKMGKKEKEKKQMVWA